MDLQNEPVIKAHPCHFGQHVAAKHIGLLCAFLSAQRFIKKPCCNVLRQIRCSCGGVAMITSCGPKRLKERPSFAMRRQIPRPCRRILASDLTKLFNIVGKAVKLRVYHRVRTVGCDDVTIPITVMDYLVPAQIIKGVFCG
jgi:hypothetical protein